MTTTNENLAERFVRGDGSGEASRMEICVIGDTRYILGYGWAVYAAATPGAYYLFGDGYKTDDTNVGWSGYSSTTTKHIQIIKAALETFAGDFAVVDKRVEASDLHKRSPEEIPAYLNNLKVAEEVEPLDYTGYRYRREA